MPKMSKEQGSAPAKKTGGSKTLWAAIIVIVIVIVGGGGYYYYQQITAKPVSKTVVFYSWWATTGKVGLDKGIIPAFEKAYPGYTIQQTLVPGAAGTSAEYAVMTLIESGHPPTSFQAHFGPVMLSYVEVAPNGSKTFVNATPVLQQMGLLNPANAFQVVMQAGAFNGTMFSFPATVHRNCLLFFNPQTLAKYNLPIPNTVGQLLYDTKVLYQHGIYFAIPGGDGGWDQMNLWEAILLSYGGPKLIDEFDYGVLNTSNPAVVNATNTFLELLQYNYPGAASMSWTELYPLMFKGQLSFEVNGEWFAEYAYDFLNVTTYPATQPYTSNSSIISMDEPFPGTSHYYSILEDSIAVPTGPQENLGLMFVKFWDSYQGQQVWTHWKSVTFYTNGTDWYTTPSHWFDYEQLKSLANNESAFCYPPSDGGMFNDAFATALTAFTTLSETGSTSAFYPLLNEALSQEHADWMTANSLHMGFMGFSGHPFGGYYPPWVSSSSGA